MFGGIPVYLVDFDFRSIPVVFTRILVYCSCVCVYHMMHCQQLNMEEESQIVPKKKVVSPVWDYFGLEVNGEGKIVDKGVAVCHQCNSNVRASGGNTSNLLSHLRTHHLLKYTLVLQAQKEKEKAKESSTASSSLPDKQPFPIC